MSDPVYRTIADEAREASIANEQARIKASQDFGRLDRMMQNEDVRWLLETHLQPLVDKEDAALHNLAIGKEKCWEHLQRFEIAKQIVGLLASEHARLETASRLPLK